MNEAQRWVTRHTAVIGAILPGLYLLITSTRDTIPGIWPYDAKRILQFALLLFLFLIPLCNCLVRNKLADLIRSIPTYVLFVFGCIFLWGLVSTTINAQSLPHVLTMLIEVSLLFSLLLGALVLGACRRVAGNVFDKVALSLLAATAIVVGFQEILGVVAAKNAQTDFNYSVATTYFSKPRFYNQVQAWLIPLIPAILIVFRKSIVTNVICLLALSLLWYVLVMTMGRGAIISVLTAILTSVIIFSPSRKFILTWQTLGLFAGIAIFFMIVAINVKGPEGLSCLDETWTSGRNQPSQASAFDDERQQSEFISQSLCRPMLHTSGRFGRIWPATAQRIYESPLTGIGPKNFACTDIVAEAHPHNFLMQITVEWGLPVGIGLLLLTVLFLFHTIRKGLHSNFNNETDRLLYHLLITSFIAASFYSVFSGVFVMPASQVSGMLVFGMLLSFQKEHAIEQTNSGIKSCTLPIVGVTFAAFLCAAGFYELSQSRKLENQMPPHLIAPRIWQDAKICSLYTKNQRSQSDK